METPPSITKFTAFVQLKDFRGPTQKEYVRYVRKCGEHYQCDPLTLSEDQLRTYFLFLRQQKQFGPSAMKLARCALRAFFRDCHQVPGWTVFEEVRCAAAKAKRERIHALLDWKAPPPQPSTLNPQPPTCPCCGKLMVLIGTLPRAPT